MSSEHHNNAGVVLEICGITFRAYHGALPEERRLGQRFEVDVTLFSGFAGASELTDELNDTLDYSEVCRTVVEIGTSCRVTLLERLARMIADALLNRYEIDGVRVTVAKRPPEGLVGAPRRVAVSSERRRTESSPGRTIE